MATKEKKSKRQRREEIIARVNREQQHAVGAGTNAPRGAGAPRVTGSQSPERDAAPRQKPKTDKRLPE